MYKKLYLSILFLLCMTCLSYKYANLAFASSTKLEDSMQKESEINISFSYDGTVRSGRYVPINIEYVREKDFNGKVLIKTATLSGENYRYEYITKIKKDDPLDFRRSYYIPVDRNASSLSVEVYDEANTLVAKKDIDLDYNTEISKIFIGVLSDTPDSLSYFDNVSVNKGVNISKVINLSTQTFPEDMAGLSQLDIVLISNYRMQNLSDKQSRALMEWVREGGIMLLGTGKRADDVLSRYAPELLDYMYEEARTYEVDMGYSLEIEDPGNNIVSLDCVDIQLHSGNILVNGDIPLLSSTDKVHGFVVVSAYDFVQVEDYANRHSDYAAKILSKIWTASAKNIENMGANFLGSDLFYALQPVKDLSLVGKLPSILLTILIMFAYIFFIGPILYLMLRHLHMEIHYRNIVILFTLLFSVFIYMLYDKYRFHGEFYNYAAITDVSENAISEEVYINLRSTDDKPYGINIVGDYNIVPVSFYEGDVKSSENSDVTISYKEDENTININSNSPLLDNIFRLNRLSENTKKYGIESSITLYNDEIFGTVTNKCPCAIKNAAIIMFGKLILLGDLEPEVPKDISGTKVYTVPIIYNSSVANLITGLKNYNKGSGDMYIERLEQNNLIMLYMYLYHSGYNSDARIIGFVDDNEMDYMVKDKNIENSGRNLLSFDVEFSNSLNGSTYQSILAKSPAIIGGGYDSRNNTMYGLDPVILEYQLGTDMNIDELHFEKISGEISDLVDPDVYEIFKGEMSFFNYRTNRYDLKSNEVVTYTKEELAPYLSPSNTMTIRYVDISSVMVALPMLSVSGRLR